jgi:hypothetical protein
MKFLIVSKPRGSILQNASPEAIQQGKDMVQQGMDKGIIEAAYGLVSGGSVWVVNVDSNESLATWLRRYKFIYVHDVEVTPITDLHDLLDGYISHRS